MKQKKFGPGVAAGSKVYMGIDQSYSGFGITLLSEDGAFMTTVTKFESTGVDRLKEIHTYVTAVVDNAWYTVQDIAMEGYAYGSQMANMAGELGATVKLALYPKKPLIVAPTALKKYVTGKGNAGAKSQMMLQVYKKWRVELLDDNAADSYGLARIASGYAKTDYEQEVLGKLERA